MNQQQRTTAITLAVLVLITWTGISALLFQSLSEPKAVSSSSTGSQNLDAQVIANNAEGVAAQNKSVSQNTVPTATLFPKITTQPTKTATTKATATATPSPTFTTTATPLPSDTATATATNPPATPTLTTVSTTVAVETVTIVETAATIAEQTAQPSSGLTVVDILASLFSGSAASNLQSENPQAVPAAVLQATAESTARYLLVDQDQQVMFVYENGQQIRHIPVSTGRPVVNNFTPAWEGAVGNYWGGGPFRNSDFFSDYMWYLFPGDGGSILIHSLPYTLEGDQKIYDRPDALGVEPASHGCVRISPEDAQWLKAWNPVDAPIKITKWSGKIGPADLAQVDVAVSSQPSIPSNDTVIILPLER